ncbi:MAG: LysR family transcriptional regulator [Myxococcales bacterium]|nr:LysR family transcriptional regulator [Myxococcales bacterium]
MDLNQLRVLDALLRTSSTVRAARELGLTQSAISHALRRLRDVFEDPLFVRVGRRLVPTERALALRVPLEEARAALERVFRPQEAFDPATLRTTFRLVAADYAELVVLPGLMRALGAEAPGVELSVVMLGDELEDALQRGDADLAIGGRFRERAGLVYRALRRDPLVCVVRRDGLHDGRRMTLRRYLAARHVLVSPRGLPGGIVDDRLAALGHERHVVLRTPSFQTALAVVSVSDLVTTVPRSLVESYPPAGLATLAAPIDLPEIRFGLLFSASRREDSSHRWLRQRIVSLVGVGGGAAL